MRWDPVERYGEGFWTGFLAGATALLGLMGLALLLLVLAAFRYVI